MTAKKAISIIDKLREGCYNTPTNYYQKRSDFEMCSYSCSAMNEIKFYLMKHEKEDPILLMEEFKYQMDQFACCNVNTSFMFSVYCDIATDVLDLLLGVEQDGGE